MARRLPSRPGPRRPGNRHAIVAIVASLLVALAVAGCEEATVTTAEPQVSGPTWRILTLPPGATTAPAVSSPTATDDPASFLKLPHADPALESQLPQQAGGTDLQRFSMTLDSYIASSQAGGARLMVPWLVPLGVSTDKVTVAVSSDLTGRINFTMTAFKVPGVSGDKLQAGFADSARQAKWTVNTTKVAQKTALELIDPEVAASTGRNVSYAYASNEVLWDVVTDDPGLLVEAYIKLP